MTLTSVREVISTVKSRVSGSVGADLIGAAGWSLAGAVVSRGIGLAGSVVVARLLQPEAYGQVGVVQNTIAMFGVAAGFGMSITATKHLAEDRERDPARAGRILALTRLVVLAAGIVATVAVIVSAPWLGENVLASAKMPGLVVISAPIVLFSAMSGVEGGALAGLAQFRTISWLSVATGIFRAVVLVIGALNHSATGVVVALVVSEFVGFFLCAVATERARRRCGIVVSYSDALVERPIIWGFSVPALMSGLVATPISWLSYAIIARQPGGYAEIGVFNAALQWRGLAFFVPNALAVLVLPTLAASLGADDRPRFFWLLRLNLLVNCGVALLVGLVLLPALPRVARAYGGGYGKLAPVASLLLISAVLMVAGDVAGRALASVGAMWSGALINFVWAVTLLGVVWILRSSGATGLAVSQLVAYLVLVVMAMFVVLAVFRKGPSH